MPRTERLLPTWLRTTVAHCLAGLVVALAVTVVLRLLLMVRVVTFAVVAALLVAALLAPVTSALARRGVPSWLAALLGVLVLLGLPLAVGFLRVTRATRQLGALQSRGRAKAVRPPPTKGRKAGAA